MNGTISAATYTKDTNQIMTTGGKTFFGTNIDTFYWPTLKL